MATNSNLQDPNTNDPAYRILKDLPLGDETKADLWQEFEESRNAADLATRLVRYDLPEYVDRDLIAARKSLETDHDAVINSINHLSKLDPKVLALAEAHPNVLKHLMEAAKRKAED